MGRPDKYPEWASSGANVVEPSSGYKSAGYSAGEQPPAGWINWKYNKAYLWLRWIDRQSELGRLARTEMTADLGTVTIIDAAFAKNASSPKRVWLAIIVNDTGVPDTSLLRSLDGGRTWSLTLLSATSDPRAIAVAKVGTYAVALRATGHAYAVHPWTSWTNVSSNGNNAIAVGTENGAERFVTVGASGTIRKSATNAVPSWTSCTSGTTQALNSVAFSPELGKWVAVGDLRICECSEASLSTWTATTVAQNFKGVTWNGSVFVAVDANGDIYTSATGAGNSFVITDGGALPSAPPNPGVGKAIHSGPSGVVYMVTNSLLYVSADDGETWTNTGIAVSGVCSSDDNGRLLLVNSAGQDEIIMTL